jgi:prepilin-type N-terminal cleavage/methylation domain-containing protein
MTLPRRKQAGFTLIEILIALAIFSSILVLLASAFTGAARTRDLLEERYGQSRRKGMTLDRLGTDLAGAVSAVRLAETHMTAREDTFSGRPGATLAFTAFVPASETTDRPSSGLVKIRYYSKVSSEAGFIDVYREQSDLALIENRLPIRETCIARRIRGFKLSYDDGTAWRTDWPPSPDRKGMLPKKVAITVIDENDTGLQRTIDFPLAGREPMLLFSGNRPKT